MEEKQGPFGKMFLVCTNMRENDVTVCANRGDAEGIRQKLKELVEQKGLKGKIRVVKSGCLGLCGNGPNIIVMPENIWLKGVKEEDLPKILEKYLK